jgi:DNA-binding response OmpR family regulator
MVGRILVVDDDDLVLSSLSRVLKKMGNEVVCIDKSAQALAVLEQESFDLAILDIRMPGISGIDLLRGLREKEQASRRPRLPVIVLTGYADEMGPKSYLELGADAYLQKPYELSDLLAAVRSHLRTKGTDENK